VEELEPLRLSLRESLQVQTVARDLERPGGNVHPKDLLELRVGEHRFKERAFATTEVEDASGPGTLEDGKHRAQSLLSKG
jgi:hypothetical protein